MPLRSYKPTSPGIRFMTRPTFEEITTDQPHKPLLEPMKRTSFSRDVWVPARTGAEIPGTVTMHDLRHYYASLLIRPGESVKVVQARLGHASAQETLDTYSHLWPDSDDRTRQAIDAVLGSASGFVPPTCHVESL